jgi:hypothetical protein
MDTYLWGLDHAMILKMKPVLKKISQILCHILLLSRPLTLNLLIKCR